jgi:RimJ/RimL family protein N-acetyltransferase
LICGDDHDLIFEPGESALKEPAQFSMTQTLRDGRQVEIRAQRPQDRGAMEAAVDRMSSASVYRRFFGVKREFSDKEASSFLDIDFVNQVALVVVATEGGTQYIIGGGRYVLVKPGQAEIAFAIVDEYQGQGVGGALMRHLTAIARDARLKALIAEVLAENAPMLKVFEKCGLPMSTQREHGVVHVTLHLS